MSTTIDAFLKKYKLADSNISSYDNDTIQMITEILNGNMHIASQNNGIASFYRGLYYRYIKADSSSAEKYYLMAIQNNPIAMNNLGFLYKGQNKLVLAEKYYLMAIENDNNNPCAMCNLGALYTEQNKLDLAEKYFLMATEYGNANAMYSLGVLYEKLSKFNLAEKYYLMAIENEINNPDAMYCLGRLYVGQNKFDLAEKYYLMSLKYNNQSFAMYDLGSLYERLEKFDLAIKHYAKFISSEDTLVHRIRNIIQKLSSEEQLDMLESVPLMRTDDELSNMIPIAVHYLYMNKKIKISRYLSHYLIDDIADICLSYY